MSSIMKNRISGVSVITSYSIHYTKLYDADTLIGYLGVQSIGIDIRMHRHGLYAELLARTNDAQGNFATVGDQNFAKHGDSLIA